MDREEVEEHIKKLEKAVESFKNEYIGVLGALNYMRSIYKELTQEPEEE